MTRIQEIEQEILTLAQQENEKYPIDMPENEQSHFNNSRLGDWARRVIDLWAGREVEILLSLRITGGQETERRTLEFKPNDPQSKFNLVKHITERGQWFYEVTNPDTQIKLDELVRKWERERERESNIVLSVEWNWLRCNRETIFVSKFNRGEFNCIVCRFSDNSTNIQRKAQSWAWNEGNKDTYDRIINELEREVVSAQESTTNIQNQLAQIQTDLNNKTNELNQELTKTQQLQQNLTELQTQKQTNEAELKQQIRQKEAELQRLLTESKESTASLRQEIEALKKELQESKAVSKQELTTEQKKLKDTETKLTEQINVNQQKEQSLQELETNLANSEKVLAETREQLAQSQSKVTQLETQVLNHEQLKGKYEEKVEDLSKELNQVKEQLAQSLASNQQLEQTNQEVNQELSQTKEILQTKQEQLKKTRLEVVGLQAKLKNMPKPEPIKPASSQAEPIDPWKLGIILVVGVGLFLLLNRRKE